MLSVSQSAEILGVTPARVRALIKSGTLTARKNGREWILCEEDVLQRAASRPRSGRPSAMAATPASAPHDFGKEAMQAQRIYRECLQLFQQYPSDAMIEQSESYQEASFYMAVADFFLQQRQAELVAAGVY